MNIYPIKLLTLSIALALSGCATSKNTLVSEEITKTKEQLAEEQRNIARQDLQQLTKELLQELTPKVDLQLPKPSKVQEKRFDLIANLMPASVLYQTLVDNTGFNLVLSPEVKESISINLKDVSMTEALDILRQAYGIEYEINGRTLLVSKPSIVSKTFQVNYLLGIRRGVSDTRVVSGSIADGSGANSSSNGASNNTNSTSSGSSNGATSLQTSRVSTSSNNDFWTTLQDVLISIVGKQEGRQVVVNPQAGLVYVRAGVKEMREVESYLKKMQNAVARQVMLEAKIIEVSLKDGTQTGINWAAFDSFARQRFSVGGNSSQVAPFGQLAANATLAGTNGILNTLGSSALGMAFTTNNFAALLSFLETQGSTQVLSTPRVATLNNQKAVLKVGNDEFFVTNISTSTTTSGNSTVSSPTISVQPFFSGIALDVTPQIDDEGFVILHIRPSISDVVEKNKSINLGSLGTYNLPLAASSINESDSIVKIKNGNIVAIGGLMRMQSTSSLAKVPGAGDVPLAGHFFKNTTTGLQKTELVILIKPTIIERQSDWSKE